jgi:hypothetical protein
MPKMTLSSMPWKTSERIIPKDCFGGLLWKPGTVTSKINYVGSKAIKAGPKHPLQQGCQN